MSYKEVLGTWRRYTNSRVQTEQIEEEKEMRERREVDLGGEGVVLSSVRKGKTLTSTAVTHSTASQPLWLTYINVTLWSTDSK